MKKIDLKGMILDAYCDCPCPDENKKVLDEIVEVENAFLDTLNDEQKSMYVKIDFLKGELDVLMENQIVEFVLNIF